MEDDQQLLAKARQGDEHSFRCIVQKYEQAVYATTIGMLGNTADAEDITQEVFIRFHRSLHQFKGEASLGTYLTRIAINLSINEQKKRKRRRWMSIQRTESPDLQISDPTQSPERSDLQDALKKALQILEPDFRSVLVLRLVDGYSVQETAEILQLPMGTVASRLARAQKKLQEILKQWL
ncbi:MAG: sigma-70 family RNA polymerase sigma factor [Chitinophagales bacterium]|nr:sigma-70 family RNA polymerase sigma factor [Chitinophagales bacterium]